MNFFTILLILYIPEKPSFIETPQNYPNSSNFDIISYFLELNVLMDSHKIKGSNKIEFMSLTPNLQSLTLHFTNQLQVDSIKGGTNFYHSNDILEIELPFPLDSGEVHEVKVFYQGYPPVSGDLGFRFINSRNLAYTMSEPDGARLWFPCFDEPFEKSYFSCKIKVPSNYVVASNGNLDSVITKNDTSVYYWSTLTKISPYLIAIAIHPYKIIYDQWEGMEIMNFVYAQDSTNGEIAFEDLPQMLSFLSSMFDEYPFKSEKYGNAEILAIGFGAMEHSTITFIDEDFVQNPNSYWTELVNLHELAHHWFGNSVTCKEWADIWLNEGFARFCEALWIEHKDGYPAYLNFIHQKQTNVINSSNEWSHPIYNPPYLFNILSYDKGACVLHMLRFLFNDDTLFFNSLKDYHLNFKYKSATTIDLKNFLEQRTNFELDKFFEQWIFKLGHPIIEWNYDINNDTVKITVQQIQDTVNYETTIFEFPLEIGFVKPDLDTHFVRVFDSLAFQEFEFVLNFTPQDVILDPRGHILMEKTLDIEEKIVRNTTLPIVVIKDEEIFIKGLKKGGYKIFDISGRIKPDIKKLKTGKYFILFKKEKYPSSKTIKLWLIR